MWSEPANQCNAENAAFPDLSAQEVLKSQLLMLPLLQTSILGEELGLNLAGNLRSIMRAWLSSNHWYHGVLLKSDQMDFKLQNILNRDGELRGRKWPSSEKSVLQNKEVFNISHLLVPFFRLIWTKKHKNSYCSIITLILNCCKGGGRECEDETLIRTADFSAWWIVSFYCWAAQRVLKLWVLKPGSQLTC